MNIDFRLKKDCLSAVLMGELDENSSISIRSLLDDAIDKYEPKTLILDFSKLTFMDSTGIGILLGRYKKFKNKNITIFIKNPSKRVDLILKTAGIYTIMQKI